MTVQDEKDQHEEEEEEESEGEAWGAGPDVGRSAGKHIEVEKEEIDASDAEEFEVWGPSPTSPGRVSPIPPAPHPSVEPKEVRAPGDDTLEGGSGTAGGGGGGGGGGGQEGQGVGSEGEGVEPVYSRGPTYGGAWGEPGQRPKEVKGEEGGKAK